MTNAEYEALLKKKKAEIEKQLDEDLKHNGELRKVFKEHPKRREDYISKLLDSEPLWVDTDAAKGKVPSINPISCKSCWFSQGNPPFEDSPEKPYCVMYSKEDGQRKPHDVYYEGKDCEYYEARV